MEDASTEPLASLTCQACGGATRREKVNMAIWSAGGLVVVENIAAHVCVDCAEQSYDEDTSSALRHLSSRGFPRHQMIREITVPVFSLEERTATDGDKGAE